MKRSVQLTYIVIGLEVLISQYRSKKQLLLYYYDYYYCKNEAEEKVIRTQTGGWFLYLDIKGKENLR